MTIAIRDALRLVARESRVNLLRTMRQFSEEEIVIPSGPYEGERFRVDRHPVAGLLLEELPKWKRSAVTGPGQDGKSLCSLAIPIAYHLFEVGEDVICGVPNMDMAADKWRDDILPVIESSRFSRLLPTRGAGSRGGKVTSIKFRNGRVLRFMSGGGRDKSKAGKTSRVVAITETDGMDAPVGGSKEADPIRQLEARTKAFRNSARIYLECTPSTEEGRIWREVTGGSNSRIEVPCPHCNKWITWEREHLVGWQDAQTVMEAEAKARLVCPQCGGLCDDSQRLAAVRQCRLVHGRTDTDTLGFRWNAAQSCLKSIGEIAKDEWRAAQSEDVAAHKALNQFTWAKPVKPEKVSLSETDWSRLAARQGTEKRGAVPSDAAFLTAAMDIQPVGEEANWVLLAWLSDGSARVVDYGIFDVPRRQFGEARSLEMLVKKFADCLVYPEISGRTVRRGIVDAGACQSDVVAACRSMWPRVIASKGFGIGQVKPDRDLSQIGYEGKRLDSGDLMVDLLADFWKTRVHDALRIPVDQPGSLALFATENIKEHRSFVKHLTAERQIQEYVPGKGNRVRWEMIAQHRPNHWLDATAMAYAARQIEIDCPLPLAAAPVADPLRDTGQTENWITNYGRY